MIITTFVLPYPHIQGFDQVSKHKEEIREMQFMHLWRHQSKAEGVIKYRLFKNHFTDQITHYSHIVTLSPVMEKIPEVD